MYHRIKKEPKESKESEEKDPIKKRIIELSWRDIDVAHIHNANYIGNMRQAPAFK